ncbi:MAG: cytochrome c [Deltaproteobacteria bacterium]|nr:cytochrome c [Deltaproteobacteria bacterium]
MHTIGKWLVMALLAVVVVPVGMLSAQQPEENPYITYRRNVMRSVASNMGGIGDILKNQLPFQANLAEHAKNVERSAAMIAKAFEQKATDEKKGGAKEDIWKDYSKFKMGAENLTKEAQALTGVMAGGDSKAIMGQLQKVGKACKDCHEAFRKPMN